MDKMIAIAFSIIDDEGHGVLHKYGDPAWVRKWYNDAKEKYIEAGLDDIAEELKLIEGNFTEEEMEKIVGIAGYIGVLYRRVKEEFEKVKRQAKKEATSWNRY